MSIDPTTVPNEAVVECDRSNAGLHRRNPACGSMGIRAVFVPVPEGVTYADAEAALADAGAWVEVDPAKDGPFPDGARIRDEWVSMVEGYKRYVHRDDLPPTDPDAELVEKLLDEWIPPGLTPDERCRRLIAIVREHEAKS